MLALMWADVKTTIAAIDIEKCEFLPDRGGSADYDCDLFAYHEEAEKHEFLCSFRPNALCKTTI